jgi:hypothetical protein
LKLIAALILLLAVASAADLPQDITGMVVQEFDNGSLSINTSDGLVNAVLAFPVSLPNGEMQFEVLGRDILGRLVVKPFIEGCQTCSMEGYEQIGGGWVQIEYPPGSAPVLVATELTDSETAGESTRSIFYFTFL